MSPKEKSQLDQYLTSIGPHELRKLKKQALSLRNTHRKPLPSRQRVLEDDEEVVVTSRKEANLDEYLWRIVSSEDLERKAAVSAHRATVVGVAKTTCTLHYEGQNFVNSLKGHQTLGVAVGDEAFVDLVDGRPNLRSLVPRRTVLSRPDVDKGTKERVIAANIDTVVVVVSIVSPPLHPRLIDRYLVAVQRGGSRAVIAVNKVDLSHGEALRMELEVLEPYRALDIPVFECSANNGQGIAELRVHLKGGIAAFVGHSGVGKSSLINAFDARLNQEVGKVSEGYGRGTHTTTSSSLIDLGDLKVIDTPGIRSFGLWDLTADDLHLYFPEFALAGPCKFSDCAHTHEPHCAVKFAVEEKRVSKARYDTYLRIYESL